MNDRAARLRQAHEFRAHVAEYSDWPQEELNRADQYAVLIELGAASYNSDTRIVTSSVGEILQLIAAGELTGPTEGVMFLGEQPNLDLALTPRKKGLRIVLKINGIDTVVEEPIPAPNLPSMEDILGEDVTGEPQE
jgi:hypothetical protein